MPRLEALNWTMFGEQVEGILGRKRELGVVATRSPMYLHKRRRRHESPSLHMILLHIDVTVAPETYSPLYQDSLGLHLNRSRQVAWL